MTVSGVRKSCTTPESIWPIAASRSRCSASSRFRRTLIDRPACPAMRVASRSSLSVNPEGLFRSASAPTTPSSTAMGTESTESARMSSRAGMLGSCAGWSAARPTRTV